MWRLARGPASSVCRKRGGSQDIAVEEMDRTSPSANRAAPELREKDMKTVSFSLAGISNAQHFVDPDQREIASVVFALREAVRGDVHDARGPSAP